MPTPNDNQNSGDADHFRILILGKFDDIAKQQASTNKILEKLSTALIGDPELGTTGVVKRLANVEQQSISNGEAIKAETNRVNMKLAYFGGIGTALGTASGFIASWWMGHK